MSTIKDEAVCILARNYSETSQIVSMFSLGHGRFSAIAKGARRERGQFGGGIDLLTSADIQFVPARSDSSLATLTEYTLKDSFPLIRRDLLTLNCAQYMCEILSLFTGEMDPHENLYRTFIDTLGRLEQTDEPAGVLVVFELELLKEIGLSTNWQECAVCGGAIQDKKSIYFSSTQSGPVCRDCEPGLVEKRRLEPAVLQLMQKSASIHSVSREVILKAHELLCYHQMHLAGKKTKLMDFVNSLLQRNV
ncbi:MAG: DNA repair protein RecO [Sedimentisphaerales bacterium]|nr:DNA repair protein RecO [Sedimentisphaerales bacterium]